MTGLELETTGLAVGGEAVARDGSGRVVFVSGAAPGERVRVELGEERANLARARVIEVLAAAPERVEPPCPNVAAGCGGCDWQHLGLDAQHTARRNLVAEVLARAGGVAEARISDGPSVAAEGVRTTVRGGVERARFAYHRRRSHDLVPVETCLVAHPLVEEILAEGRFGEAAEVVVRVGSRTGERQVLVTPSADDVSVPTDVVVIGADQLAAGRRSWIHEEAAGRRWRVSAGSFFQPSPEGAEALVAAVGDHLAALAPTAEVLADLCSGVGLFAGTVGAGRRVLAVERSASAVADARVNLAAGDVRLVRAAIERWRPGRVDAVVADPARQGLGAKGVAAVDRTGATACVLVSCDLGALGRDTRLLREAGFDHAGSTVVDLFAHTGQVEVVSGFVRSGGRAGRSR